MDYSGISKLIYVLEEDNVNEGTEYYWPDRDGCQMCQPSALFPTIFPRRR